MVRHIKKRLLGRTVYGLLMVMGSVSHTTYGSWQTVSQREIVNLNEMYLEAVGVGGIVGEEVKTVHLILRDFYDIYWEAVQNEDAKSVGLLLEYFHDIYSNAVRFNDVETVGILLRILKNIYLRAVGVEDIAVAGEILQILNNMYLEAVQVGGIAAAGKILQILNNIYSRAVRVRGTAVAGKILRILNNIYLEAVRVRSTVVAGEILRVLNNMYLEAVQVENTAVAGEILRVLNNIYLEAVRVGDVEIVRQCLQNGLIDVNAVDRDGNTDIMLAIKGGEREDFDPRYQGIFNLLIQRKDRNWNLRNKMGQTPLLLSVIRRRSECVEALLERPEVDPNIPSNDGVTPLLEAIWSRQTDTALRVINNPQTNVSYQSRKFPLGELLELPLRAALKTSHAALKTSSAKDLVDPICWKSLKEHGFELEILTREMIFSLLVLPLPVRGSERLLLRQLSLPVRDNERLLLRQLQNEIDELIKNSAGDAARIADNPMVLFESVEGILSNSRCAIDGQAISNAAGALCNLIAILLNPRGNVGDHNTCSPDEIVEAIRWKINRLRAWLPTMTNLGLGYFNRKLLLIEKNTQLLGDFLSEQNDENLAKLRGISPLGVDVADLDWERLFWERLYWQQLYISPGLPGIILEQMLQTPVRDCDANRMGVIFRNQG